MSKKRINELVYSIQNTKPYRLEMETQVYNFADQGSAMYYHEKDFHKLERQYALLFNLSFELARLAKPKEK